MPLLSPLRSSWHERLERGCNSSLQGQHEYVFGYGPSLSHLKIVLSTVAINLFRTQGMPPTQLAAHVADWAPSWDRSVAPYVSRATSFFPACYGIAGASDESPPCHRSKVSSDGIIHERSTLIPCPHYGGDSRKNHLVASVSKPHYRPSSICSW